MRILRMFDALSLAFGNEKNRTIIGHPKKEAEFKIHRPAKVLFDHLPKCGGTTINLYLPANYPERFVYIIDGI